MFKKEKRNKNAIQTCHLIDKQGTVDCIKMMEFQSTFSLIQQFIIRVMHFNCDLFPSCKDKSVWHTFSIFRIFFFNTWNLNRIFFCFVWVYDAINIFALMWIWMRNGLLFDIFFLSTSLFSVLLIRKVFQLVEDYAHVSHARKS